MDIKLLTDRERALIKIAEQGNNGDTTLRKVDGQISHVNEIEANIIDKYGKSGEDLVKSIGSGTVNSETGLKEYSWLTGWLSKVTRGKWATKGFKERQKSYKEPGRITKEGLEALLETSKRDLGAEGSIAQGRSQQLESIQTEISSQSEQLADQTEQLISSGGFATSGNAQNAMQTALQNQIQGANLKQQQIDQEATDASGDIISALSAQKNNILATYLAATDKAYSGDALNALNAFIEEQKALQD